MNMRKIHILLLLLLLIVLSACAPKAAKPTIKVYTLEDNNYPCIKVDFSDQIRYIDMSKVKDGDNIALLYELVMPGYQIEVIKMYALKGTFSTESLPSLYDDPSKLFEISSMENPDKSAVITLEDTRDGMFLRGSVGYFIQSDRMVRVNVSRLIKKSGTFKYSGLEDWSNSTIGKRTIENMKTVVDSVYTSLTTTQCPNKADLNTEWWK